MQKHLNIIYPEMPKYTLWDKVLPLTWQDATFKWTKSPQQHNTFTKASISKWKKYSWGEKNWVSF